MIGPRICLGLAVLALTVSGQTVISTHSGILYFFEGNVYLGGERLEQKFGKFPDIGEGRELRTEQGRAEVLLTPGVFLRIGDASCIKMISERLDDTRVELVSGSAIIETNEAAPNTSVTLIYKQWQVKSPKAGAYRMDADPAQLHVYRGEADVAGGAKADPVVVKDGEKLALAQVLAPEQTTSLEPDNFKNWAMNRSQEVSNDNAIASEIQDDPSKLDPLDPALAGFTYFPMTGVPSLGITNPYGVSFWSPYQASLASMAFSPYLYGIYPGWPSPLMIYRPTMVMPYRGIYGGIGSTGIGVRPGTIGIPRMPNIPRPPMIARPAVARPPAAAPRAIPHR